MFSYGRDWSVWIDTIETNVVSYFSCLAGRRRYWSVWIDTFETCCHRRCLYLPWHVGIDLSWFIRLKQGFISSSERKALIDALFHFDRIDLIVWYFLTYSFHHWLTWSTFAYGNIACNFHFTYFFSLRKRLIKHFSLNIFPTYKS